MEINESVFNHSVQSRKNRQKIEILVVEDDDFSRQMIMKTVKDHEAKEAANGDEALKAYALNAPDLVLLDIELPDIQGIEILKLIQAVDPDPFVVMLTSHTDEATVKSAITNGAKGYIAKPMKKDRIMHYIAECESHRKN